MREVLTIMCDAKLEWDAVVTTDCVDTDGVWITRGLVHALVHIWQQEQRRVSYEGGNISPHTLLSPLQVRLFSMCAFMVYTDIV